MKHFFVARTWQQDDLWVARVVLDVGSPEPGPSRVIGAITEPAGAEHIEQLVRDLIATTLDVDGTSFGVVLEYSATPVKDPREPAEQPAPQQS